MPNRFDPTSLVVLPRLDALTAQSLARALETSLDACIADPQTPEPTRKKLQALRKGAFRRLRNRRIRLGKLQVERQAAKPAASATFTARQEAASAWGALENALAAWVRTPRPIPQKKTAASLHDRLFADGLAFTQTPAQAHWSAAQNKLQLVDTHKLEPSLGELGLLPLLAVVRQVHEQLGDELGITHNQPAPSEAPRIDEAFNDLRDSIRFYVVKVGALGSAANADATRLAGALLQPLRDLDERGPSKKDAAPGPQPAGPASP